MSTLSRKPLWSKLISGSLTGAVDDAWSPEDDKGHGVRGQDAAEEDVRQFSARGHDDGRPVVNDEDDDNLRNKHKG